MPEDTPDFETIGKLFVQEGEKFFSNVSGAAKAEVRASLVRSQAFLEKALLTGDWAKYGADMKFEVSVLASVASIGADKAEQHVQEATKKAVKRGLALLFAAIA